MFPLSVDNPWLSRGLALLIAFAFGFVLERSGFGDARRLAAQFYLHEMRVLKVMFTAIVVAMVLLFWSVALGWTNLDLVFVNPTHLWPAIVGGLVLGAGFIIGGYCPGTSLVSLATLKVDGLFFALGVAIGVFAFGETVDDYRIFFERAGDYGRWQISELLGLPTGWVVAGVVFMAIGVFWGVAKVERAFRDRRPEGYDS